MPILVCFHTAAHWQPSLGAALSFPTHERRAIAYTDIAENPSHRGLQADTDFVTTLGAGLHRKSAFVLRKCAHYSATLTGAQAFARNRFILFVVVGVVKSVAGIAASCRLVLFHTPVFCFSIPSVTDT